MDLLRKTLFLKNPLVTVESTTKPLFPYFSGINKGIRERNLSENCATKGTQNKKLYLFNNEKNI